MDVFPHPIRKCIQMSLRMRRDKVEDKLLQSKRQNTYPRLKQISDIEWFEPWYKRGVQIALRFVILPLWFVGIPFAWVSSYLSYRKAQSALHGEIHELNKALNDEYNVKPCSLEEFWNDYGLNGKQFSEKEQLQLLESWLPILYAPKSLSNFSLRQHYDEANKRREELMSGVAQARVDNGIHLHVKPKCPFKEALQQASNVLPLIDISNKNEI
ncbi:hypothetical protein [Vibrio breoganii]|uniref:hypothetical protein n=1 Tax=Vibrio breoganii TaxID=553239 RepID=UPI00031E4EAB|nr:hypothetical protein [Vibrio breoganii]OED95178.1 hypothetical protein A1QE_15835 [Vibrio breoganii ZF-55]